ncbi:hypothetical protein MNR02_06390 [Shinella sp. H4-D48]|uniref:hypothetical protein n=1 Tax=Shinella sp. H4-D48 TaxID=2925841 RepID=UPI001F536F3F|nr:hypothetical protein [Shinella sp. H4-D48]UNK39329.1 hypothetical protein MNR02_06390 [Shinella sp. H4-D48]
MTSPVSAIEAPQRFSNDSNPNGLGYSNGIVKDDHGYYVLHSDYEALARQAEALQRENAEKDAEIAKLRGMIRDNGTPRFNAICGRAEAAEREVAELRAVMKDCHSALKMLVSPGVIQGTTVIGAFAAVASAECRARALLGGSENAE